MKRARSERRLFLWILCAAPFAADALVAGITISEECEPGAREYLARVLKPSPQSWAAAAQSTLVSPRACQRTFTARLKDQGLVKPTAVVQIERVVSEMRKLDVRVECREKSGVAYQSSGSSGSKLLRVAVGSDYDSDPPNAPQQLTALRIAMAMIRAAAEPSTADPPVWVEVPPVLGAPPLVVNEQGELQLEDNDIGRRKIEARQAGPPVPLLVRTIAFFLEETWTESISRRKPESLLIVGRLWDTETGRGCPGHDVLDQPDKLTIGPDGKQILKSTWTPEKNEEWLERGVACRKLFYVGARVTELSLCRDKSQKKDDETTRNEDNAKAIVEADDKSCPAAPCRGDQVPSVFRHELCYLQKAGYRRWGNYLVHPEWPPDAGCPPLGQDLPGATG